MCMGFHLDEAPRRERQTERESVCGAVSIRAFEGSRWRRRPQAIRFDCPWEVKSNEHQRRVATPAINSSTGSGVSRCPNATFTRLKSYAAKNRSRQRISKKVQGPSGSNSPIRDLVSEILL